MESTICPKAIPILTGLKKRTVGAPAHVEPGAPPDRNTLAFVDKQVPRDRHPPTSVHRCTGAPDVGHVHKQHSGPHESERIETAPLVDTHHSLTRAATAPPGIDGGQGDSPVQRVSPNFDNIRRFCERTLPFDSCMSWDCPRHRTKHSPRPLA